MFFLILNYIKLLVNIFNRKIIIANPIHSSEIFYLYKIDMIHILIMMTYA